MTKAFEVKRKTKDVANHFGKIDIPVNDAGVGYYTFIEKN
jgi:NAD(P)-dependent dehydrogenase (short-subunit alcohol dehydrogenase family)